MARTRRYELGVGCLLVAAAVVLAVIAVQIGALSGWGSRVVVSASFGDANGLTEGAVVAVAGVPVGEVRSLGIDHDQVVAELALEPDVHIRTDAVARIRARSMLGEKFVDLQPRSLDAPLAKDGDMLQTVQHTEIDQMVNELGPLVGALDPEALTRLTQALTEAIEEDPDRIKRMLEHADTILARGAEVSEELPGLVDETRATLRETRATLAQVDARARELEPLLSKTDTILDDVGEASADLPELVADVEGLVGETREVVAEVDGATGDLKVVLGNLSELDKAELERLIREEGVLIRLKARKE